ncbi:pyroglutamyl-peptidase I [Gulosibacter massiliensis]|uniref:pyroglutamyl-peptidase I n=1 Tax=Gulosibacter massiliensis TaxID=2479839 RepID=UPI000F63EC43|nr:pyroglutamyl-peptidase I [Gulosibacter massiliensis]
MRILVTAFEPFDGEATNPSLDAVRLLPPHLDGMQVDALEVPTAFGRSVDVVIAAIGRLEPDAVLCVGQAGGRGAVTPERVAINLDDARIPDNAGGQPIDRMIDPDGPPAIFSTLPVKAMVQAIRDIGIPAELSNTAGTYVCNHLMYGVLRHAQRERPRMRSGFVHVPYSPEQAAAHPGAPSLPIEDTARALIAALRAIGAHDADLAVPLGATH